MTSDRYARLHYGFDGNSCDSFLQSERPNECIQGSGDAQNASAVSSFFFNFFSFVTSSLIGSISDTRGRKREFVIFSSTALKTCFAEL